MKKELRGAVLIIGSLFWEDESNAIEKEKGILRASWREQELALDKGVKVSCSIRYGRKSETRRNTYTMIFSNSVPAIGRAWLVPFKNLGSNENDFDSIYQQAKYLSLVEGIRKSEEYNTHKKWGMVALKIMPELEKKDSSFAEELKKWWSNLHFKIINEKAYRIDGSEEPAVTSEGFLNLDFEFLDESLQLDYVLATPVVPNIAEYPSSLQIVDAIKKSSPKYYTYFIENYKNGINTFQDEDIRLAIIDDLPEMLEKQNYSLKIEDYAQTSEGYYQFQHDLLRELGKMIFVHSELNLRFHVAKTLDYKFETSGVNKSEVEVVCAKILDRLNNHFKLFSNEPDARLTGFKKFLPYILGIEKLPGIEKERIEAEVKEDLKRRRKSILKYERENYIKEFKADHILPRNHSEKILHDFYLRNVNEEQIILNYFLDELDNRAIYNCIEKLTTSQINFDWYYDRPYLTSLPSSEEYFDHTKIDLCGHKMGSIPIQKGRELQKIYYHNKIEFYKQLQEEFNVDQVFHEINYFLSYLPPNSSDRKKIFEELILDFKDKKWYSFYSLGLTQIEGIFSEMAASIDSKTRKPSLPDKVEFVRPSYEFAHSSFDYYQYHVPVLRNRFMHYGLEEEIEVKCFDILYDLRHLLNVYIDLKTPLLELNKLIKRSDSNSFYDVSGYNYFFDLVDLSKGKPEYKDSQKQVTEFERDFLIPHTEIQFIIVELEQLVPQSIKHLYDTISFFTELNTVRLDVNSLTSHQLSKNLDEYVERIKPVYHIYEDTFTNISNYHNFLKRCNTYLPSLSKDLSERAQKLYDICKDDFEKHSVIIKKLLATA